MIFYDFLWVESQTKCLSHIKYIISTLKTQQNHQDQTQGPWAQISKNLYFNENCSILCFIYVPIHKIYTT